LSIFLSKANRMSHLFRERIQSSLPAGFAQQVCYSRWPWVILCVCSF
jgi:hypothetical protein